MNPRVALALAATLTVAMANLVGLVNFPHTRLGLDWDFESFTLVVKSIILEYGKFPIHDPWVAGGIDILANPHNRVFSPSLLLDLLLNPTLAGFSITLIWGFIGYHGFFYLLKFTGVSDRSALIFSALFIFSSYFGLHFSEGHISFASWQALGLIFYLILNIDKVRFLFAYALLMIVLFLDGNIHVLLFSQIIFTICLAFNMNGITRNIGKTARTYLPHALIILVICGLIACVKAIPMLSLFAKRPPVHDYENMSLLLVLRSFFDPFQYAVKETDWLVHAALNTRQRFHEYGCYIGLVTFFILAKHLFKKEFLKANARTIVLAAFFFWIGSGWLEVVNPWKIFERIPLLNNVHVPSRLFIVVSMLILLLMARLFDGWRDKPVKYWGFVAFLLAEGLFVRNYPFYKIFDLTETRPHLTSLITSDNVDRTAYYGRIPYHHYKRNTGAETTYDPAKIVTPVRNSHDTNYRGEIYSCDATRPKPKALRITRYIPGEIHLRYDLDEPGCIQLNTNHLLGWSVSTGDIKVTSQSAAELLTLEPMNAAGDAVLIYRPSYLKWSLPLFALGLILTALYWRLVIRRMKDV